jgi:aspartate dehydrogenase
MENKKKKLGMIGCGAIGTEIVHAIDRGDINVTLYACFDTDKNKFDALTAGLKNIKPLFVPEEELIKNCDIVVECAHKDAVKNIFQLAVKYERDIMFLSAGGVLENLDLIEQAKAKMINVYVPSGAVVGLDGLDAAKYQGLHKVTLITRKPPRALNGVKYLIDKGIDVNAIKAETVVFEGNALDAVKAFPQNINVAATLSMAGVGPELTHVRIVADPFITNNIHEILVEGEFGRFRAITENLPSPSNPKTSYLTSLSAIVMLKKIVEPIHIGT